MPNELVTLVERFVADAVANATADLRGELDREHERAEWYATRLKKTATAAADLSTLAADLWATATDILPDSQSPVPEAVSPPTPAPAPDPPLTNAQIIEAEHERGRAWVERIEGWVNDEPVLSILGHLRAIERTDEELAALEVALFVEQHGRNRKTLVEKLQERIAALSEASRVERLTALGEVLTGGAE